MATVVTNDRYYKEISEKINNLCGTNRRMYPRQMAKKIEDVYDAGKIEGKNEGKDAYHEEFWNEMSAVLRERSAYSFGGRGWNNNTFRPPYPIRFYENAKFVLRNTRIDGDIRALAEIDFSQCTSMEYAFSGNHWLTAIGVIDASSCKTQNAAYYFGCDNRYLHTVEEFVSVPVLSWDGIFANCPSLYEIRVSGTIDSNKVNFSQSPNLSRESIESIINACSDNVTTITFSFSNIVSAFGGEYSFNDWVSDTKPNITVALV